MTLCSRRRRSYGKYVNFCSSLFVGQMDNNLSFQLDNNNNNNHHYTNNNRTTMTTTIAMLYLAEKCIHFFFNVAQPTILFQIANLILYIVLTRLIRHCSFVQTVPFMMCCGPSSNAPVRLQKIKTTTRHRENISHKFEQTKRGMQLGDGGGWDL